jgi:hypothetical protein
MLQFNFDATKGETPASIAQKRALVAQLMTGGRAPQNVGEGFSAIGDGIVANVLGGRAERAETEGRSGAQDIFRRLLTGQGGAPTPSYDVASIAPQTASDATAAMAGGGDFISALVNSESGGNWQALNSEGYGGRLQFGEARLADAARAGIIPPGMTGADFAMMPPEVQQAVEQWHFADIDRQAQEMGLTNYYGQTIAGVPINENSIRSMAHLGGIGGAQKFVTTGGQYNPADSNGTRLSDYGSRFGGMGGGSAPVQVAQGPDMATLMEAASNPFIMADPGMASVVNSMLQQQMQMQDPRYQQQLALGDVQLETERFKLDALRNAPPPKPGAPKTEKMYDPETGREQVMQWDENAGQWVPLGGVAAPKEPLVQVNMGDGAPGLGKLSTDYGYKLDPATGQPVIDPETGLPTAAPVPGSPAALEIERRDAAANANQDQRALYGNVVTEEIDRALELLEQDPTWTTGILGQFMGNLKGSNADRMENFINTVKANAAFDRLQAMRDASPTGGALGAVSAPELLLLESAIGSLERSDPKDLAFNLQRVQQIYNEIINGPQAASPSPAPAPQSTVDPNDIDALLELYK